jgi:hypothetical protein
MHDKELILEILKQIFDSTQKILICSPLFFLSKSLKTPILWLTAE